MILKIILKNSRKKKDNCDEDEDEQISLQLYQISVQEHLSQRCYSYITSLLFKIIKYGDNQFYAIMI